MRQKRKSTAHNHKNPRKGLSLAEVPPAVAVVIFTPRGEVVSNRMPSEDAAKMRELIESDLVRIERLTLDTPDGVVIIPGDLLRQSLIRLQKTPVCQSGDTSP